MKPNTTDLELLEAFVSFGGNEDSSGMILAVLHHTNHDHLTQWLAGFHNGFKEKIAKKPGRCTEPSL